MKIYYGTGPTLLASSNPADRRAGPAGLSINGSPIMDVVQFYAAANATLFGRDDGPVTVSFRALADFDIEDDLIDFIATHREGLVLQGALLLKNDAGSHYKTLANAVREVRFGDIIGFSVYVSYLFTGSKFT